ncbi:MAG: tRNA 2-thiouridine(34) synthase MnmA [Patescibacteria group bacterium]|jgi:tRNA-specific 2-thiouridylase
MDKNKKAKKIIVAMSGGVDSSVSALFLKKAGFNVEGLYMKLPGADSGSLLAAEEVAKKLGIKFHAIDMEKKFRKEIIGYFLKSYKRGITPNPCVRCNQRIKFGELLKTAKKLGGDFLATGHYIQLPINKSKVRLKKPIKLLKAKDVLKDQSYFLYTLSQNQLAKVIFPLGGMLKEEVKKIAEEAGLPNMKNESQDICFLYCDGKAVQHNDFLRKNLKLKSGPIMLLEKEIDEKTGERKAVRLTSGKNLVEHQGLPLYTIGQRREIRIGGTGPYYAARFDMKKNILYVVKNFDDPVLFQDGLIAKGVSWITGIAPKMPLKCEVVIRYRHAPIKCEVIRKGNSYIVKFKKPQRAITPGQSIVFYKGREVLGGGEIS